MWARSKIFVRDYVYAPLNLQHVPTPMTFAIEMEYIENSMEPPLFILQKIFANAVKVAMSYNPILLYN